MSWSTSEALTDPAIREPMSFHSEFKFYLRDIPVEITVRLIQSDSLEHRDRRAKPSDSVPGLDPQEKAACEDSTRDGKGLQQVASEFVCVYNAAIAKGLMPDTSWLQANPEFR